MKTKFIKIADPEGQELQNECVLEIGHFTHVKNSDVYLLVSKITALTVPENYTEGNIEHIFIIENDCLNRD